jgi:CsoR family transcriptional regulator, copper-sensing transcriptional repressor
MKKNQSPSCHIPENAVTEKKSRHKTVVQPNKEALLKRMNRITGQVQGINRMLQEDRYCVDILTQISAVKSALDSVAMQLLEDHTHHCVRRSIQSGEGDKEIAELIEIFRKYARS